MKILIYSGLSDKKLISKITFLLDKKYKVFLSRKIKLNAGKVFNIQRTFKNKYVYELERLCKGISTSKKEKIDFYIGIYLFLHGFWAFLLSKIFNKPLIQILPGSDVRYVIEKQKFIFLLKYADYVITRGKITDNELKKLGVEKEKLYNIPNHFDFNSINYYNSEKVYDFIFIGSFVKVKRIDVLINAVAQIKDKLPDIKIALLGDGGLKEELKELIDNNGIRDNFELLGYQDDVNKYISQSKAFIMTSEYEGLPQAMIEALAHGIPCIMPRISNIPEVAKHNYNSLLVDPLDVDGFADAIYRMMTDDELYNKLKEGAENFRAEHEYEYSLENISRIWDEILTKIENDPRVKGKL